MAEEPNNINEDIDIGPLTLPELQSLARDTALQLRRYWQEILSRASESQLDAERVLKLLDLLASAIAKET